MKKFQTGKFVYCVYDMNRLDKLYIEYATKSGKAIATRKDGQEVYLTNPEHYEIAPPIPDKGKAWVVRSKTSKGLDAGHIWWRNPDGHISSNYDVVPIEFKVIRDEQAKEV